MCLYYYSCNALPPVPAPRLVKYLSLLSQFVAASGRWEAQLRADRSGFIWSSPLSNYAADARLAVRSVQGEEIMASGCVWVGAYCRAGMLQPVSQETLDWRAC